MWKPNNGTGSPIGYINNLGNRNECAVYIRDLVKRYGKERPTLKKFGMTVNRGTIYGLLGSSGCGKTTILSCLVGLQTWDSGEVLVLGQRPGKHLGIKLGYMPQELSLYDQLSIYEIIQFYGKLYKLPADVVQGRWEFLQSLLQFPTELKLVRDLSGGQRRRASLALALIHSPELLILDEPTVGLDPLLRQKIWNYLSTIVKTQNTTIIITTHYMEEARFCDMIGVMRNGQIIAENTPSNLLAEFNCDLLEDAVTKLCRKNESQKQTFNPANLCAKNIPMSHKEIKHSDVPAMYGNNNLLLSFRREAAFDCEKVENSENSLRHNGNTVGTFSSQACLDKLHHSFQKIYGLTLVQILTFIRHPVFLVTLLIMPTIQCCLALATIGCRVRDIPFGVVNLDLDNWKSECELQKSLKTSCDLMAISCGFINKIQEDNLLVLHPYESEQLALQQAHMGEIAGYLSIPANYSTHLMELATQKHFSSNESLAGSRIRLKVDHSQYLTAYFIVKNLYNHYLSYSMHLAESCGMSKQEFELPLNFRRAVYGDYTDNYVDFMLPGDLLMAICCLTVILTAMIFVSDHKQGTLSRARVAGLNIADIMTSHIVIQSIITLLQNVIVTAFLYAAFGYRIHGLQSQILYLVFNLLSGIMAAPFGLLLGILFREEVEVFIVNILLVPNFLFWGGIVFPTETTTWFWQQLGYIIPLKVPIMALRSVLTRGLGITHPLVWIGFVAYGIFTVVFAIACVVAFKALKL